METRPAETPSPPRRRRVGRPRDEGLAERRREEILAAATRVFADRGFPDTDLELVAREVGVSKGTLYRYFPSKRDLFLAAVDRGMLGLREELDRCFSTGTGPVDRIEAALRTYLRYFAARPDLVELLIQERAQFRDRDRPTYFVHRDAAVLPWRDLARELVATGVFRPVSPELVADLVSNLLYGTLFTNHFADRPATPDELDRQVDQVRDVLLHGILAVPDSSPPRSPGDPS